MRAFRSIVPANPIPAEVRAVIREDRGRLWALFGMAGVIGVLEVLSLTNVIYLTSAVLGGGRTHAATVPALDAYLASLSQQELLVTLGVAFIAITVSRLAVSFLYHYRGFAWSAAATGRLHTCIMERLVLANVEVFDKARFGQMMFALMDAPFGARLSVDSVVTLIEGLLLIGTIGVTLAFVSPSSLLLAAVIFLAFFGTSVRALEMRVRRLQRLLNERQSGTTQAANDTISGIRDIKTLARESEWKGRFTYEVLQTQDAIRRIRVLQYLPGPSLQAAMQVAFAATAAAAGFFLAPAVISATLPAMGALAYGLYRVYPAMTFVSKAWTDFSRAVPLLQTATEWTKLPEDALACGHVELGRASGTIRLDRVSFAYNGSEPALQDVDLSIEAGKVTSLIGGSGAGKSTLIDLLLKLRAPTRGAIWIGDRNLQDVVRASWLSRIGVVRQDVFLFGGTLRDNMLAWKPDADERQIRFACREAGVLEFVDSLPAGFDTLVGERGVTLSGGQRQRIAIARALLRDPDVLVLDEAFSALDGETEEQVLDALGRNPTRTILLVSHRLTTIRDSDRIIVLDGGRVIEQGSHEELLVRRGRYCELFSTQLDQNLTNTAYAVNSAHGQ